MPTTPLPAALGAKASPRIHRSRSPPSLSETALPEVEPETAGTASGRDPKRAGEKPARKQSTSASGDPKKMEEKRTELRRGEDRTDFTGAGGRAYTLNLEGVIIISLAPNITQSSHIIPMQGGGGAKQSAVAAPLVKQFPCLEAMPLRSVSAGAQMVLLPFLGLFMLILPPAL